MTAQLDDYPLAYAGKVRELYDVDDDLVLIVASDRISAYDHVLPTPIPDKGRILTALSGWWFDRLADLVSHHHVSLDDGRIPAGGAAAPCCAAGCRCCRSSALPAASSPGPGLADYRRTGAVCGIALPRDYRMAAGCRSRSSHRRPRPNGASTTRTWRLEEVVDLVGARTAAELRDNAGGLPASAGSARGRGILLADTKLEFGYDREGVLTLGDEVLTPDSSRFWAADEWQPGGRSRRTTSSSCATG